MTRGAGHDPERPRDPADYPPCVSRLHRVCVFCGSSPGADPAYREAAEALALAALRRAASGSSTAAGSSA